MSDGNRGGLDKARLRYWLIGAIGAACAVIAAVGIQQWFHYDNAADRAVYETRHTEFQIATECVTPALYVECSREVEQASRSQQRDEYDLYSQQATALWTSVMGAMAVLGVALSAVGVYLIWGTWDSTREAAENSRKTLNSYIAKERAHIRIGKANASWGGSSLEPTSGIIISLENFGLSSGVVRQIRYGISESVEWNPASFIEVSASVLVPAAGKGATPQLDVVPHSECCISGYVDYTTLEEIEARTYFCLSLYLSKDEGFRPDQWEVESFRPPAMPNDT